MEKKSISPLVLTLVGMIVISVIYFYSNIEAENIDKTKEITIDFKDLNGDLSESDIVSKYTELKLSCGIESSAIAERYCYSDIDRFDGMNARLIVFFFEKDKLIQMKVDLNENEYENAIRYCLQEYGPVSKVKKPERGEQLVAWVFKDGMLVTSKEKSEGQNMLLWLSANKMFQAFLK